MLLVLTLGAVCAICTAQGHVASFSIVYDTGTVQYGIFNDTLIVYSEEAECLSVGVIWETLSAIATSLQDQGLYKHDFFYTNVVCTPLSATTL